jgi:long-chain fatty acid transport protein
MNRALPALFFAPFLFATSAFATGFDLREFSPSALGVAYAGAAANGERASTTMFNPALLTEAADFDVSLSSTAIMTNTGATYSAKTMLGTAVTGQSTPDGFVPDALLPSLALRYRLTDKLVAGLTVTVPWGLATKYNDAWVGRYFATKSEIQTRNFTFSAAYQILPELSIGGGLQVQYMKGYLSKAVDLGSIGYYYHYVAGVTAIPAGVPGGTDGYAVMKANDWGFGYTLGLLWKPTSDLSVGLSYRSRVTQTLAGTQTVTGGSTLATTIAAAIGKIGTRAVHAPMDMPSVAMASVKWKIDDRWNLMASADWTGWYTMQSIQAITAAGTDTTMMNWKPSLWGSVGAEYKPCPNWTLRLGTAYDATPTHVQDRTPGVPDSSRIWATVGVGYKWNEWMELNFGYSRMFGGDSHIAQKITDTGNSTRGTLTGDSSMAINLIGLEMDLKL